MKTLSLKRLSERCYGLRGRSGTWRAPLISAASNALQAVQGCCLGRRCNNFDQGGWGPGPEHCYELVFEFDDQERIRQYRVADWPKERPAPEDLLERAKSGDAEAQWELYSSTGSIRQNETWLCLSADQGHPDAQRRVALMYRTGWAGWAGLQPHHIDAYMWYTLSAAGGNELSKRDAREVWKELTPSERERAESRLSSWKPGLCERDIPRTWSPRSVAGLSVDQWLKRASGPNPDPEAQYQLWWMTEGSDSYKWLCRAADQGHPEARARLGMLYEYGSAEVDRDLVRACLWYRLAAPEDYWAARDAERILGNFTPNEIAEAEQLLSGWELGQCERELLPAVSD